MASSEQLPPDLREALNRGRAIPLLVDYRSPELADHTLTVIGLIDSRSFEGIFLPDWYSGEDLVKIPLPSASTSDVSEIKADSADAAAVHELWSRWNSGIHNDYLQFARAMGLLLSISYLKAASRC
eukprot:TRINITY_DN49608_c0_g2_i2.p1 TRINITY_DN49608_c0_g2~~TRINITY_DN49608_c0_g2_i2.p1  ORF type:complete len:126 (+),score=14.56 TRINITY_DN49608_c0_g2_i2:141-518(+)